jgi:MFS family permease
MILTFVGVYLKEQNVSNFLIGIINGLFFLGAIVSSIFSQKIISTVGHIRSFATFSSIMVISFLLHLLEFNVALWMLLRFICGFSYFSLLIILESWLNEKSTQESRGKILAFYTIVFYLSTALGQLFLNIGKESLVALFIIGSVLLLIATILISLTKIKEPTLKPFLGYKIPKIYSVVPLAFTTSLIAGFLVAGLFTMMPVYLLLQFHSVEVISYFMLLSILGGLFSQWPVGVLSDKYGRRKFISFSAMLTAIISFLFLVLGNTIIGTYILGFFLGFSLFTLYPLALARANDVVDEDRDIVEISRTLLFSYGIGSFLSPIVIGIAMSFFPKALFMLSAFICLFLAFYSLSKKRVSEDDMSVYVNFPVASSGELPELDPRGGDE